jgi:hypothetical protein
MIQGLTDLMFKTSGKLLLEKGRFNLFFQHGIRAVKVSTGFATGHMFQGMRTFPVLRAGFFGKPVMEVLAIH